MDSVDERLLVFNSHEGWISLLEGCGYGLDIVVGLPGRFVRGWDQRQRAIPHGARLIPFERLAREEVIWTAAICSNIADLMLLKEVALPKLLVLHKSLNSSQREQGVDLDPAALRQSLGRYLDLTAAHAVAVSPWKAQSWGVTEDVLLPGLDPDQYLPWTGVEAAGIRVAHQIDQRPETLLASLHDAAFAGLPVKIVGHNPQRSGATISRDHDHLKWQLSRHRFIVHTADPELEDGFNLGMIEGMAAGLPVLANRHPSSPIRHEVDGFLSDDPQMLRNYAERLIADRALAERMGQSARARVRELFARDRFHQEFGASVLWARALFQRRVAQGAVAASPRTVGALPQSV